MAFVVILSRLVQGQLDLFWVAVQTSIPFLIVGICLGAHGRELADQPPGVGQATERSRRCPTGATRPPCDRRADPGHRPRLLHQRLRRRGAARQRARRRPGRARAPGDGRRGSPAARASRRRATASTVLPGQRDPRRAAQPAPAARPSRRGQRAHDRGRGGPRAGAVAARRAGGEHPPLRLPPRHPPPDAAGRPLGHATGRRPDRRVAVRRRPRRRRQHRRAERRPARARPRRRRSTGGRSVLVAQRLEREKHTDVAVRAFAASGLADARVAADASPATAPCAASSRSSRRRSSSATPWSSSATAATCGS